MFVCKLLKRQWRPVDASISTAQLLILAYHLCTEPSPLTFTSSAQNPRSNSSQNAGLRSITSGERGRPRPTRHQPDRGLRTTRRRCPGSSAARVPRRSHGEASPSSANVRHSLGMYGELALLISLIASGSAKEVEHLAPTVDTAFEYMLRRCLCRYRPVVHSEGDS